MKCFSFLFSFLLYYIYILYYYIYYYYIFIVLIFFYMPFLYAFNIIISLLYYIALYRQNKHMKTNKTNNKKVGCLAARVYSPLSFVCAYSRI